MNEDKLSNHEIKIRLIGGRRPTLGGRRPTLGGKGTRAGAKKGWETRRVKRRNESKQKQPPPIPSRPKKQPQPKQNYLTPEVNIYTENVRISDKPIKSVRDKLPPSFEREIREQKKDEFQPIQEQIYDFLERNEMEKEEFEEKEKERRFWAKEDRKAESREDFGLGLTRGSFTDSSEDSFRDSSEDSFRDSLRSFGGGLEGGGIYNDRKINEATKFNRLMNVRNQYGFTSAQYGFTKVISS